MFFVLFSATKVIKILRLSNYFVEKNALFLVFLINFARKTNLYVT